MVAELTSIPMAELPAIVLNYTVLVLGYLMLILLLLIGYTAVSGIVLEFVKNRLELHLDDFRQIHADLWTYRACREYAKKNPPPNDLEVRDPALMLRHAADRLAEFADIEGYVVKLDSTDVQHDPEGCSTVTPMVFMRYL